MRIVFICAFAFVFAGASGLDRRVHAADIPAPALSTPATVTFGDVSTGRSSWRYFATSAHKPLYTFDADGSGHATCVDECAKEFTPYLVEGDAKPVSGDWSIVPRGANERQWAFRGRPLYTFNGRDPSPRTSIYYADADRAQAFDPTLLDPGSDHYSPRKGWRRAAFMPEQFVPTPADIALVGMAFANGYGFADATTRMPLYVMQTAPKNPRMWKPKYAPSLAVPIGDFTVVVREDGTTQWAYKGFPLYSYAGDYLSEDMNGILAQSDARVALAYEHFMPAAFRIQVILGHGPMLTTSDGKTVYAQGRGGRRGAPRGRAGRVGGVGTSGCVDECLKSRIPVLAGPKDRPWGLWEVQERPDGSRQWAYGGAPLYTYTGDKKPGDAEGNGAHVIVYGKADGSNYDLVTLAGGNRGPDFRPFAGAGLYWQMMGFSN